MALLIPDNCLLHFLLTRKISYSSKQDICHLEYVTPSNVVFTSDPKGCNLSVADNYGNSLEHFN